jgi:hypothetical protein
VDSSFPLDQSHLQLLNSVLDTEPMLMTLLPKCQNCDLDTSQQMETAKWQMDHARKIKANFFPDYP